MPVPQIQFEGTWEEVLLHSHELTGQKVRVTVIRVGPSADSTTQLLAEYHALADIDPDGSTDRLNEIERRMDKIEATNPNVQAMYRRIDASNEKLDQILSLLTDRYQ